MWTHLPSLAPRQCLPKNHRKVTEIPPFLYDFKLAYRYSSNRYGGLQGKQEFTTISTYPSERAFVLQFHREADLGAGRFLGRIEHVASGKSSHFQSLEELTAFVVEYLPPPGLAERGQDHD